MIQFDFVFVVGGGSSSVCLFVSILSLVRENGSPNPPEQLLCNCECRRVPLGQLDRNR